MKVRLKSQSANIPSPLANEETPALEPAAINYPTTKEHLDSVWGNITIHSIKVMADGRQWVIDALSGKVMERKDAQSFRDAKNNVMWIPKSAKLSPLDKPMLYQWKNPGAPTF